MPWNDDYEEDRHRRKVEYQNERLIELEKERLNELKRMNQSLESNSSSATASSDSGGGLAIFGCILYIIFCIYLWKKTNFWPYFGHKFGIISIFLAFVGLVLAGVVGSILESIIDDWKWRLFEEIKEFEAGGKVYLKMIQISKGNDKIQIAYSITQNGLLHSKLWAYFSSRIFTVEAIDINRKG